MTTRHAESWSPGWTAQRPPNAMLPTPPQLQQHGGRGAITGLRRGEERDRNCRMLLGLRNHSSAARGPVIDSASHGVSDGGAEEGSDEGPGPAWRAGGGGGEAAGQGAQSRAFQKYFEETLGPTIRDVVREQNRAVEQ